MSEELATNREMLQAERNLADVATLARAAVKNARKLAELADHVLVPRERYDLLERLLEQLKTVNQSLLMTRDYKDLVDADKVKYGGKKYLLSRSAYEAVLELIARLGNNRERTKSKSTGTVVWEQSHEC